MNTISTSEIRNAVAKATQRIAPLWPLSRFVAVNPFAGFLETPFDTALDLLERNSNATFVLPPSYYRSLYADGTISREDLFEVVQVLHPESFKSAFTSTI